MTGGPHGLHPTGQGWVNNHGDAVNGGGGVVPCQNCHGSTYVGTVLSYSQAQPHIDHSVWHQDLLPRLPGQLLYLPQRTGQRLQEPLQAAH